MTGLEHLYPNKFADTFWKFFDERLTFNPRSWIQCNTLVLVESLAPTARLLVSSSRGANVRLAHGRKLATILTKSNRKKYYLLANVQIYISHHQTTTTPRDQKETKPKLLIYYYIDLREAA